MNVNVATAVKKHFTLLPDILPSHGGARKYKCSACDKCITGSATKLRAHLLCITGMGVSICDKVSEEVTASIISAEEEHPPAMPPPSNPSSACLRAMAGNASTSSALPASIASKSTRRPKSISDVLRRMNKSVVDQKIANLFYANGIAFNVSR